MKSKKGIGTACKEAGILFGITLIAGLLLGFFYELTKEPIAGQKQRAVQEACAAVFPAAFSFEQMEYAVPEKLSEELAVSGVTTGSVYLARSSGGSLLGYVIQTASRRGYGGDIVLYVGVSLDGTLNDVSILEISETPGLGMRAKDVLSPQFHGKKAESFVYTKAGAEADNEIDAIANATITTRAFTNAVNGALRVARELNAQGAGGGNE